MEKVIKNETHSEAVALHRVLVCGYEVVSDKEVECVSLCNLVKGSNLQIFDAEGKVVYQGVRGFLPLSRTRHLVRFMDGGWHYCSAQDGHQTSENSLQKVNLKVKEQKLMFDERGKLRMGMSNSRYKTVTYA